MDLSMISGAHQTYRIQQAEEAADAQRRRVDEATIAMSERSKTQIAVLKEQLAEAQRTNELLTQQASEAKQFAEKADKRSGVSILVAKKPARVRPHWWSREWWSRLLFCETTVAEGCGVWYNTRMVFVKTRRLATENSK